MSVTTVPGHVRNLLWGKAAGRCQYEGCNEQLNYDPLTKVEFNTSYIAHIYADSKGGPRYDPVLSVQLKSDISNLMLLCDKHHRLIDKQQIDKHPAERLVKMKQEHELRIALLTDIIPNKQSHIVLFGANIGNHQVPLNYREASNAIVPHRYPSKLNAIELGLKNSTAEDHNPSYWGVYDDQLKEAFHRNITPLKGNHEVQHFSVFALAPMPLLIRLGTLFSDIYDVDVFQRHREPCTWTWQPKEKEIDFRLKEPLEFNNTPILKLSLSANITNDRIVETIEQQCSIWEVTIETPHNDFLKTTEILADFRKIIRYSLDVIKSKHGQNTTLHVFPAIPISAAVEFGRVWMPKADMPMIIYDQSRVHNKFISTLNFN